MLTCKSAGGEKESTILSKDDPRGIQNNEHFVIDKLFLIEDKANEDGQENENDKEKENDEEN